MAEPNEVQPDEVAHLMYGTYPMVVEVFRLIYGALSPDMPPHRIEINGSVLYITSLKVGYLKHSESGFQIRISSTECEMILWDTKMSDTVKHYKFTRKDLDNLHKVRDFKDWRNFLSMSE